jgi:hypothetical protein
MNDNNFKEVDIRKYVKEGLKSGLLKPQAVVKVAKVYARKGILGETIETIGIDGFSETINTVKQDENGNLDWVVTDIFLNSYVVADSVFRKKYDVGDKKSGIFKPKLDPVVAIKVDENLKFIAPWKEKMYIKKGSYLIMNSETDIYGIQDKVFFNSYVFYNDAVDTLPKKGQNVVHADGKNYCFKTYNIAC